MAVTEIYQVSFFIGTSAGRCAVTVVDYLAIIILIALSCRFGVVLIRGAAPKGKTTAAKQQLP
jgi:hypothetical protein